MRFFDELGLLSKIDKLIENDKEPTWSNNSFFHGKDVLHYFGRNFIWNLLIEEETGLSEIEIMRLDGITHTNTNIDEGNVSSFVDLTTDWKKVSYKSEADFINNCKWINERTPFWTCWYQTWNKKTYIDTFDGSHHFSAVYRQATEQGRVFKIKCKLYNERPNLNLLAKLSQSFYFFYMSDDLIHRLNELILYNYSVKEYNPLVYPINVPHLVINRTEIGSKIAEKIIKNDLGRDIIAEIKKCLTST